MIFKTPTEEEIKKILLDKDIYPVISEDGNSEDFQLPEAEYIGAFDPELIGVSIFHQWRGVTKFHPMLLKKHRSKSMEFFRRSLDGKNDVYASVPECYPRVIRFAEHFGFKKVGLLPGDFLKNGVRYDMHIMRRLICHL